MLPSASNTPVLLKLIKNAFRKKPSPDELNRLALHHHQRGQYEAAERYFGEVAVQRPADPEAWVNLAATLLSQQKYAAAIPVLRHLLELDPGLAEAQLDIGLCYNRLRDNRQAIAHLEKALALKPELAQAHANIVNAYMDCCEWNAVDRWIEGFNEYRKQHSPAAWAERIEPFCALSLFPGTVSKIVASERAKRLAAAIDAPVAARQRAVAADGPRRKIKIGYVSADFYDHATAHLTFGLYAAHNRQDFEVYGYSLGPDDQSTYRRHIESTCDRFADVREESAARIAERVANDAIDILVDMKGYTANARPAVFAYRPAPIQVSYLGYPGTSGADFMDYFISDAVATPPGLEEDFTEHIVYLPDSYQINDSTQTISRARVLRADFQLPEDAFVFCSFNTMRKIDRRIFAVWMQILGDAPGSVLWLLREDPAAERRLKVEAAQRGIDPDRLIFADRTGKPEHLARCRLADLFLDTTMCNAHTGASDALWAGLPVLTCPGSSFISRVAASLVCAAGLPELIAQDVDDYRRMAIRLAAQPEMIAGIRNRLEQNRMPCALFDTARYVRNLEAAYRMMFDNYLSGGAARPIRVTTAE
jgi:protein O-GlcNAc transferase